MPLGSIPSTKIIMIIIIIVIIISQAWWRMLVIPVLGRLRPEDPDSRPASAT